VSLKKQKSGRRPGCETMYCPQSRPSGPPGCVRAGVDTGAAGCAWGRGRDCPRVDGADLSGAKVADGDVVELRDRGDGRLAWGAHQPGPFFDSLSVVYNFLT